jgi:hypothetical protein
MSTASERIRQAREDRAFDWDNNQRVIECCTLHAQTLPDGTPSFALAASTAHWETSPVRDLDKYLDVFRAETAPGGQEGASFEIDENDDVTTPDTVRAVSITLPGKWRMRFRVRWVYPGLYDNVERLRAYVRTVPLADDPRELAGLVDDALSMILTHDRGERDRLAPEGHCRHGVYVGGCGIDYMCGACEDGSQ